MSRATRRTAAAGVAVALLATLPGIAAPANASTDHYVIDLTGAAERPGPGDPDGTGTATIVVRDNGRICYAITVRGLDPLTAAHIHVAPTTDPGPVVAPLPVGPRGGGGCVMATPELTAAIQADPASYYVNVHNAAFPAGALRGQLA